MKEAEVVGEHSHSHRLSHDARSSQDKPLQASQIDMDEIFCTNSTGDNDSSKECNCKACLLTKLSDEERAKFTRQPLERPRIVSTSEEDEQRSRSVNITQPVDISLDEVFAGVDSSTDALGPGDGAGHQARSSIKASGISRMERVSRSEEPASQREVPTPPTAKPRMTVEKVYSSSSSLPYSHIDLDDVFPKEGKTKQTSTGPIPPPRHLHAGDRSSVQHASEENLGRNDQSSLSQSQRTSETQENRHSADWVEKLVKDDSVHMRASPSPPRDSKSSTTAARASHAEEVHAVDGTFSHKTAPNHLEKQARSIETSDTEVRSQAANRRPSGKHTESPTTQSSEEWLNSLVGVSEKPTENKSVEQRFPTDSGAVETATTSTEGNHKQETQDSMNEKATNRKPDQSVDKNKQEHFNTTTVMETQNLVEMDARQNFENEEHLSPKDYVSKAYAQRLSQLKMELGITEEEAKEIADNAGASSTKVTETSEKSAVDPVQAMFYTEEPPQIIDRNRSYEKSISDEALIDAMFSEVLDGEASERTSVGADSTSRKIALQETQDTSNLSGSKTKLSKSQSLDNWYDQPPVHDDEEDVKDYVSDLLSQSMSEAIFSASMKLERKPSTGKKGMLITDTSFDRKLIQKLKSESVEEEGDQDDADKNTREREEKKKSTNADVDQENQGEDPILKAVFTASIDNPQFMESVISYPSSVHSPKYTSSTLTTPGTAKTKDDADVFFASEPTPAQANDVDGTYVSSASVMMNDTHSSSEGDFDDDHIIKLVFSELPDTAKRSTSRTVDSTRTRPPNMETMEEAMEESCQTPNSSVDSECFDVDGRSTPRMDHGKSDQEMLEIEVFSDHFHIKGSYSLIINKDDPLGTLLDELHAKGTNSLDYSINPRLRRLLFQCLHEKSHDLARGSELISSRAKNLLTDEDPSHDVDQVMSRNRFDVDKNPKGNINFCTAENNVCSEELMAQLQTKGFSPTEAHLIHYPPAGGHSSTKRALCRYMAEFMSATVTEEELVVLPSSTSAYDMLCHCTCEASGMLHTLTAHFGLTVITFYR
ncbi:hypothetical protein TELCIR_04552 [Teladorsagia circumcincta]|uniref:Uncharacterized protein n=1 Tax=Teladorsagia circumcincta TaxID=45464 RepID=A0A2G9UTI3_TELCI|nr:hypothetical protein TELCIR_04552 [Teladorsagia circumcincta]